MPSLVRLGDVPPARATPPYPLRNNRTPAPDPPAVIYHKVCALCDVSLLNFRSPSLPPIYDGIPDVFIEGQELDFGQGLVTYDVESDGEGVAEAYLTNRCVCCCF
jgi:hypothetical protein